MIFVYKDDQKFVVNEGIASLTSPKSMVISVLFACNKIIPELVNIQLTTLLAQRNICHSQFLGVFRV